MEAGQKAYEKAACATCHRFGDLGTEVGPDLTDVGKRFKRKDLIEAILYPSKTISDLWQATQITTTDGKSYFGVIEGQDSSQITLRLVTKEKVNIPVSQIKTREAAKVSLMPENLLNNLNVQEAAALMMFLEKGAGYVPKK
jgi:putative heme-binding domain-containing protein